jgi:hypothetical protein
MTGNTGTKGTDQDIGTRSYKHGHAARSGSSSAYNSWRGMMERCQNPKHVGFEYYGARGIAVCDRWYDFAAFLADMSEKPSRRHTIDRIDPNGNYEPANCRWATPAQQRANQRPYDQRARVLKAWQSRSRTSKNRADLVGQRFTRLLVVAYSDTRNKVPYWQCHCDCGQSPIVSGKALKNGGTKSCGCLNKEVARERAIIRNKARGQ